MTLDPDKLHVIRSKPKHDSHADAIRQFEGDCECLSNTYRCPVSVRGDAEPYPSVEHALQASKTDDPELKKSIRQAKNAIEAKKVARVIKPTPEWRAESEKVVEALVRDKFRRNAKAREVLVATGHVKLIYTNTHNDTVWGVCGGKGDNKLGKLLEIVRADVLSGKDTDVWCTMRFNLALTLDVAVALAVTKEGNIVAEPTFEGKSVVRMGKLADNEVVMAHPSISRFHALLVIDRTLGAFLVDLGASNGSFVDGRRLAPYVPEPIHVGGEELTFAKSKRTYVLSKVETDLREAKKRDLYASMSNPAAAVAKPEADSTVYVGNLDLSTTEEDLREFFSDCGDIASIRIPQDKETGKMRGIAFVAFAKHSGILHALTLNMDDLKGKSVKVRRADSKSDTSKAKPVGKESHASPRFGAANGGGPSTVAGSNGKHNGDGSGRGDSNGAGSSSSAVERATAEIIKRATEAARVNAASLNATAARRSEAESGTKRRRVDATDTHSGRSGDVRRAGRQRTREGRWGDSGAADGADGGRDDTRRSDAGGSSRSSHVRARSDERERGGKEYEGRKSRGGYTKLDSRNGNRNRSSRGDDETDSRSRREGRDDVDGRGKDRRRDDRSRSRGRAQSGRNEDRHRRTGRHDSPQSRQNGTGGGDRDARGSRKNEDRERRGRDGRGSSRRRGDDFVETRRNDSTDRRRRD